jgi:hypothetical protein
MGLFSKKVPPTQKPPGKPTPSQRPASEVASRRGQAAAFAVGAIGATGLTLASLAGGKKPDPYKNAGIVNFPADLGNIDHWIQFTAKETKGVASGVIEKFLGEGGRIGSEVNGATIRLPLPANLSADYNPSYSDESLGVAGGALKAGDRAIYGNSDISGLAATGGALAGLAGAAVKGKVDALVNIAETASGGSGFGAAALKVAGGIAQNPHKIVLFTGVDFREHQFSWKLSPRNREESDLIKYIVNMFTYYAHPEYVSGGLFFKYPEFFDISFRHPEYLFQFQPCVCKDVRVNFHGQGFPAYIRNPDGSGPPAPAEVELSLTFRETEIITKDFLNKERIPNLDTGRSQMPAVDILGNPLGNGLDVNGDPMR